MNLKLVVIVALWGILLSPLTWAQESRTVEKPVAEDTVESTVDAEADDETDDNDDNFIPTEKINVDSSVSFPVDI